MSDLNVFSCTGRLGADPDHRTFQNGDPMANLRVAVSKSWKDRETGERKEKTSWIPVTITNKGYCGLAKYASKGSRVAVSGELIERKWQDQQGNNRSSLEVHVSAFSGSLTLLDSRSEGQGTSNQQNPPYGGSEPHSGAGFRDDLDSDIPFAMEWR